MPEVEKASELGKSIVVILALLIVISVASAQTKDLSTPLHTVQLPIEVLGPDGFIQTAEVNLPQGITGGDKLQLQLHNLRYQKQASVQVNESSWIPLNDSTAQVLGMGKAAGGIGGGFSTLTLIVLLPPGTLTSGSNTLRFRFNETDGRSSGFRVLSFNFLNSDGVPLLPPDTFVQDDPNSWVPPSTLEADIADGTRFWYEAALTVPTSTGNMAPIRARCTHCHAQDGRDLKYFNYSNLAIRARSMFHGLTAQQGDQIASYIRTLSGPNPGRPWNPPYQPGPGLDSKPVTEWAAGAGLDAVASSDQDTLSDLFPESIQASVFSPDGDVNVREIRIPWQLPDWNHWLPDIHPMDAWDNIFLASEYNTRYWDLRSKLNPGDPMAYASQAESMRIWNLRFVEFLVKNKVNDSVGTLSFWTPDQVNKVYATTLWGMVKTWELMQEFKLEDLGRSVFTHPEADGRTWYSNLPFKASPHMLKIPPEVFFNGKRSTHTYMAYIWYHLQLVLMHSKKEYTAQSPIDWSYTHGFVTGLGRDVAPSAGLHYLWLIRGLQNSSNGKGPDLFPYGWNWGVNDPTIQMHPEVRAMWNDTAPSTRVALAEGYLRAWLSQVKKFTPEQFYTSRLADPTSVPVPGRYSGDYVNRFFYAIPQFRYVGVSQTIINELADWAKTIWPQANWEVTKTASCRTADSGQIYCNTQF